MTSAFNKPLAQVVTDALIIGIADKHRCSPAEVIIAWLNQQNIATTPSSTKQANMLKHLCRLALTLDKDDMQKLTTLDCHDRQAAPDLAPEWD